MSRTTRLFICLIALLTLFTLLWPGQVEASRLAACLTNVTVANTNDSGSGSLRQALADVCSGGTVDFAAGLANQTITLTSDELSITKTVTITNPNAANLQVSGNNARRVFNIQTGAVVTMSNLSTINGWAGGSNGGGIYNDGVLTLLDSTVISSQARYGGGIYNYNGQLTINNSTLSGNSAAISGGAIFNYDFMAKLTVNGSTFSNNSADAGGGILNSSGVVTVSNTTFSRNSTFTDNGGGVYNAAKFTINNSTFSGNSATLNGGGIFNSAYYGRLTLNNNTFSNNSASSGGGIRNAGELNQRNNLVANSTSGGDCVSSGMINTNLNNLVEDGGCEVSLNGDPNLGPLQDNGGPTMTHALLMPSPALDNGDNATCLAIDQRGIARPIDGNGDGIVTCDIGAFEAPVGPPSPNIGIWSNNTFISDGDTTPSLDNNTDFGSTPVTGGIITRTFIISNNGVANLLLTGSPRVLITGHTTDFSVTIPPTTPINPGSNTTFQVTFDPVTIGLRYATLSIANNDLDSNVYNFDIQGLSCPATVTVTNSGDSGIGTLRQALTDVCNNGTINFAAGLANQTITLTSTELNITKTVTITNPNAANLKVSGNDARRVFNIQAGAVVTISSLSIISGTGFYGNGGGVYNLGTLTLNNSILSGNSVYYYGGGIYNEGILTLNNSTFYNNSSSGWDGGGLYNNGILKVSNSTFSYNTADYGGGGIYNHDDGTLTVINSMFNNNSAYFGGGIDSESTIPFTITNSAFTSNFAFSGGGIFNRNTLTVNNSTFSNNIAQAYAGGGIDNRGTLDVNNSIFSSNSAEQGGGIDNGGTLILNNSTLNGNSSTRYGGGLYTTGVSTIDNSTFSSNSTYYDGGGIDNGGTLILNNSTLNGNSSTRYGGGLHNIYSTSILHLRNNLIANNVSGGDCYNGGTITTNLNNLIEDGSCSPTFSGDPFLGPLANNGGSTPTHALLPGSPAINAGNNTSCLTTDQRGIARPQQGQCDIGAFESRGFTLTRNGGHNQSTPIGSPFSTPLGVTVTSSAGEPMSGGFITFTGPGSGASTNPVSVTAVISGSAASAAMTANNVVGGPYNVAANAKGTNSVNFSLTNTKATPAVIIASSANPSLFGQTVTFTAIVTSNAGTPAGSLIFVVDGTPQSPVALAGGQATFSTSSLAVGNHTISANYSGDASFNTSSGSLTNGQTVNPLDAPTVQFTQAVYTTTESIGTSQSVILTRIGNLANASQVQVSLSGGTATAGTDYSSAGFPKTITFGSGVASQTVPIAVINDTQVEPSETISLTLSSLGNAVIGVPSSAGLQIEDNDTAAASFKVYLPTVIK